MQTLHGDTLKDDYFWMREKDNPKVRAYLEAENAYTDAFMKPTEAFQKALYDEMLGRIKQTDLSVPYRDGGWFYYSRTEKGKQYPIYCRKKGSLEAPEEVYLDVNELAKGETFMSVGVPRGQRRRQPARLHDRQHRLPRLHAARSRTCDRQASIPSTSRASRTVAWAADNKTLFYTTRTRPSGRTSSTATRSAPTATDGCSTRRRTSSSASASAARAARRYLFVGVGSPHDERVALPPGRRADGRDED